MRRSLKNSQIFSCVLLLLFSILCRVQAFGNPLVHIDEEFYLFAGGRLLHGDLPYVDIWDRKPVGIFLIYAFFHLFGPWRVWAYQCGALLSVWATAIVLMRMATLVTSRTGACVAAMLYVAWLNLAEGEGGQSPIFYNLPVACAMAVVLCRLTALRAGTANLRKTGINAMLLIGLALQIKYSAVFEGLFLGLFLLWLSARSGGSVQNTLLNALLWIGAALLPTLVVMAFYMALGHGHDWLFANVLSIFLRGQRPDMEIHEQRLALLAIVGPLLASLALRVFLWCRSRQRPSMTSVFLDLWAVSACLGFLIFDGWYTHYLLPLFPPLATATAPLWNSRTGRVWLICLLVTGTALGEKKVFKHGRTRGNASTLQAMLATVSNPPGCIFVYRGPVALYDFSRWCQLTTHPFPSHFHEQDEQGATGMDPRAELRRVLAQHPDYVVTEAPLWAAENPDVRADLYRVLQTDYAEAGRFHGKSSDVIIFRRKTSRD